MNKVLSGNLNIPTNMINCFKNIFEYGEYECVLKIDPNPIITDIGANIGLFTVWAINRWPDSIIYCYEPLKANFNLLKENVSSLDNINIYNCAVNAPSSNIYLGKNNCGEASFYDLGEQIAETEKVDNISSDELPNCHILKIDTEGCEVDIITKYLNKHDAPKIIMFEYHRDHDRKILDDLLTLLSYKLFGGKIHYFDRGTLKYIK